MNYFSSLIEAMLGMGAPPAVPARGDGLGGGFGNFARRTPDLGEGYSEQQYIDAHDLRNALRRHGYSTAPNVVRAIPMNPGDIIPVPQGKPQEYGDERDWLPGGARYPSRPRTIVPAPIFRPAPRTSEFIDA